MLRMAVAARHHRHRSAPVPALLEECRKRRLPYILGIETSCDDTAAAVLDRDGNVLSNVISSQWELNAKWKGIVPALAARAHQENLPHVIAAAIEQSGLESVDQLKAIAVTSGPGLSPCLDVGLITARDLCIAHPSVDFLQINHLEGIGSYELLGNTLDDSVGEAFDKVARMLELTSSGKGGVHGGRLIEEMASRGNDRAFDFPEPMKHRKDCDFSYSGLKTAMLREVKKLGDLGEKTKEDLCASFQRRAIDQLLTRARRACQWGKERLGTDISSIVVCGGVASNQYLRRRMEHVAAEEGVRAIFPPAKYCTDNGVMIAWAGLERHELGMRSDPVTARYTPRWPLDTLTPVT
uniref:N(6)-L-threonylcarbamoyladenine synthase n=1 Tax=Globisporangium ultimum (strain ATCC 200006 / CBS 805.95 / DAOM BR144) TaxID=431595 RepID=K3WZH4_GLOUD